MSNKTTLKEKGQKTYYAVWFEGQVEQFDKKQLALDRAKEILSEKITNEIEVTKVTHRWKNWNWTNKRDEWVIDMETGEVGEYIGDGCWGGAL